MITELMTVICPVRNEAEYIENIIKFFINSLPAEKELFIVDGKSTDNTREIISKYTSRYKNIFLIDNPDKTVPFALNIALKLSKGNPIVRLDAHTLYADDYFEKILETFEKTKADIVGGPMRAIGKTNFQKAVALCTSTKFGVGDSMFHDEKYEGFTDSVYLGAWQNNIFKKIGLFDEEMIRNQDDEFHYRAKSKNLKIYLNPGIRSWYFPRNSINKLFRQYFQYGLYKPLVLKKVSSEWKLRHLIPSVFAIYCLSIPFLYYLLSIFLILPLIMYLICDIYFSFANGSNKSQQFHSLIIYPVLHLSYGIGFIFGIQKLINNILFKRKQS